MTLRMMCFACALLVCSAARAEQSLVIEVSCPSLTSEARSAVEARAYAELMSRHFIAGTLRVACDQEVISASFAEPGHQARSLSEGASALELRVDELVSLVGKLLDAEPLAPEVGAADTPAAEEPPAPTAAPGPLAEPPPSPVTQAPSSAASPPPQATQVVPPKRIEPNQPTQPPQGEATHEALPPSTLLVGGAYEPWAAEISGTAGFLVGVTVPLASRFSVRGSANLAFGIGRAQGIGLRQLLVEAALEASPTPWSLASLGGGLSSLSFDSDEELEPVGKTTSLAPVLTAALRLVPRQAFPRFSIGVAGRWFGKVRDVTIDDEPVLHTPRASITLEAEGRFSL